MRRGLIFLPLVMFLLAFPGIGRAADENTYVGSDTCMGCHEKQALLLKKSPHWKKAVPGAPINAEGCESCHGPGSAHAQAGGGRGVGGLITFDKKVRADRKSAVCLACHENSTVVAMWDSGVHKRMDVACSDCHTVHGPPRTPEGYGTTLVGLGYSPTWEYQVCGKCHLDVKARFNRRAHHPLLEGRITCSNCHQPHGNMNPSMIKAPSVNQLCYTCHAEKRGPYMFQHPPVDENCAACHTPHGSVHEWLLTEKIPNLCQNCHDQSHQATRYSRETLFGQPSASNRSFGRSCLNCHVNIHGSNGSHNPANGFNSGAFFFR